LRWLTEAETIVEIMERVAAQYRRLALELYGRDPGPPSAAQLQTSPLRAKIDLVLRVARGELDGQEEDLELVRQVRNAMSDVHDAVFTPAAGGGSFEPWEDLPLQRAIFDLMLRVQNWMGQGDPLVSYTTAAGILYPDEPNLSRAAAVARVRRLVERRELIGYVDPDEPNPRHARRVSGADAVALKARWSAEQERAQQTKEM
jgi:hypothetical protein